MSSLAFGLVQAAAQLGLDSILVKPQRAIGPFSAYVTLTERHFDEIDVVDHPVERGSQISDHAYRRPAEVVIECMWSDTPTPGGMLSGLLSTGQGLQSVLTGNTPGQVRDLYNSLLELQRTFILFDVFTGKRAYKNMLLRSLVVETDKDTENCLRCTATCREILVADVRVTSLSAPTESMEFPGETCSLLDMGVRQLQSDPPNFNLSAAVDDLTPSGLELL